MTIENMIRAIESRDLQEVTRILNEGFDINSVNQDGQTALHLAAEKGFLEIVQSLIDMGANIDCKDFYKYTPLHFAANEHKEITRLLIERGANPNIINNERQSALTIAMNKGNNEICLELLKSNLITADTVNYSNFLYKAPLYYASRSGDLEMVELLMQKGADVKFCDSKGLSSLHVAVQKGHKDICAFLIQNGADMECMTKTSRNTPLHHAYDKTPGDLAQDNILRDEMLAYTEQFKMFAYTEQCGMNPSFDIAIGESHIEHSITDDNVDDMSLIGKTEHE